MNEQGAADKCDEMVLMPGSVYLVGAGPGDPDLITVAGLNALRAAEVVVYDRLLAPALLREAPATALLIDAGKAPGAHTLGQDGINAVLAEHASLGRTVVRLKGGDPFMFGRGGEEALYLRERGIPFRIVPGVTSAIAAPAFAGIPVTHRGIAGSVLIATGHEAAAGAGASFDWNAVAYAADTLVFLMGVERLAEITRHLLAAGRPAEQPAALVRWGSTPEQVVLTGTVGTIAAAAEASGLKAPATLVIGEVVRLRDGIAWFETQPLFGARVLVTRTRERASGLVQRLRALGALPLKFPAISFEPLADTALLDAALSALPAYDWAIFTSQTAVGAVFERLQAAGRDARAFAGVRLCAVGPATARSLTEHGLKADLVPQRFTAEAALEALVGEGVQGRRLLLPQADIARPDLADSLNSAGATVTSVAAYRTRGGHGRGEELARLLAGGVDVVSFSSSSTVTHLLEALNGDTTALNGALIASIGPATSETARAAGLRVDMEAAPHTIDGLVTALVAAWAERRSRSAQVTAASGG